MPYDPNNLSYGALYLYMGHAANHPTTPDALPADSVPFFGSWGGNWRPLGWTTPDGATLGGLSQERTPVMTAQQGAAVAHISQNAAETVGFTLIESTLQNIKDMAGRGELATVAAGAGTYGHTSLTLTDSPTEYVALGIETLGPNGEPRRAIYPIGILSITGDITLQRTQETRIPAQFARAGGSTGDPEIRDIIPPTS